MDCRYCSGIHKAGPLGAYILVHNSAGNEQKTAFRSHNSHTEYLTMSISLTNAPTTFQLFINDILRDILEQYVVAYLDNTLIFSDNAKKHTKHVHSIMKKPLRYLRKTHL